MRKVQDLELKELSKFADGLLKSMDIDNNDEANGDLTKSDEDMDIDKSEDDDDEDIEKSEDEEDEDIEKSGEDGESDDDDDIVEKSEDDDDEDIEKSGEDEDEDEDIEKSEEDDEADTETAKTSVTISKALKKGMKSSDFMKAITVTMTKSLGALEKKIVAGNLHDKKTSAIMAKSLKATMQIQKSLADELTAIKAENKRLKMQMKKGFAEMEALIDESMVQPVSSRKSVKDVNVYDKNFKKSINGGNAKQDLTKSQLTDILTAELIDKKNPLVKAEDIVRIESGGTLRPELEVVINKYIK